MDFDDAIRAAAGKRGVKDVDLTGVVVNGPNGQAPGEEASIEPEPSTGDEVLRGLHADAVGGGTQLPGVTDSAPPGDQPAPAAPLPGGAYMPPEPAEDPDESLRRAVRRQRGA